MLQVCNRRHSDPTRCALVQVLYFLGVQISVAGALLGAPETLCHCRGSVPSGSPASSDLRVARVEAREAAPLLEGQRAPAVDPLGRDGTWLALPDIVGREHDIIDVRPM